MSKYSSKQALDTVDKMKKNIGVCHRGILLEQHRLLHPFFTPGGVVLAILLRCEYNQHDHDEDCNIYASWALFNLETKQHEIVSFDVVFHDEKYTLFERFITNVENGQQTIAEIAHLMYWLT